MAEETCYTNLTFWDNYIYQMYCDITMPYISLQEINQNKAIQILFKLTEDNNNNDN